MKTLLELVLLAMALSGIFMAMATLAIMVEN
jgi:hypothetical protein